VVTVRLWHHLALAALALSGLFIIAAVIGFALG
jgi:hypothetical protein